MLSNFGSNRTILDILEDFTIDDFLDDWLTCGKINLRKYINKVIKKYTNQVRENLKELGFDSRTMKLKDFKITPKRIECLKKIIPNFSMRKIISTKGKVKYQWWGYSYELRDNLVGDYQVGYSTLPEDKRFNYYLKTMFFHPKFRFYATGQETIYNRMWEYLRSIGLKNFINTKTNYPNFKLIKKALLKRFEFIITGVYFSEYITKRSEDEQILIAMEEGTALNYNRGGGGSKSDNAILRFIITYISLGYSIVKITQKLSKNHGIKWKVYRIYSHIIIFFGGIHNARRIFLKSLFQELKLNGYTEINIYKNFKHYFDGRNTRREFDNPPKLIYLIKRGYSRNYLASYFKMSLGPFDIRMKEFIQEFYPFLEIYVDEENKDIPTFMDLKYYLMAHEILNFLISSKGKISKDETAEKFKINCIDDPDFHLHPRHQFLSMVKKVFKVNFETLSYFVRAESLYKIIKDRNPIDMPELYYLARGKLSNDYSRYNAIVNTLRKVFIPSNSKENGLLNIKANDLRKNDIIRIFKLVKIAIIAEVIERGYRLSYSFSKIAELSSLFNSENDVEFWTNKLYGGVPNMQKFPFEKYLLDKFGVRKFNPPYVF